MERPQEIIRLEEITKIYGEVHSAAQVHALRGVSLSIERGDYVAVVGASGSGKTTLMNLLGLLDRPSSGRFLMNGQDVADLDDDHLSTLRGKEIGFIFQSFNLIQQQTVQENIEVPMFYQDVSPDDRRARAIALAERVEIGDRIHHRPAELSGGQQQRVAIARALANDPTLLLADEPTGNLDSKTGALILRTLDELNKAGMTIVMVTHDQAIARRCRRVVEFKDGRINSDTINAELQPA